MAIVIDEVEATVESGAGEPTQAPKRPQASLPLERMVAELRRAAARERRLRVD